MDEFQEQAQRNRFSKSIKKTIPKLNLDAYNTETEHANLNLNNEENNVERTPREIKKRSYSEEKIDISRNCHHNFSQNKPTDKLNLFRLSYFDSKEVKCATARKYSHESERADDSFGNLKKKNKFRAKQFLRMKSRLPQSHLPEYQINKLSKHDSLADKLQSIKNIDKIEEPKEPIEIEFSQPKFLDIEIPEDSLEELARIDAELERESSDIAFSKDTNEFKYEDPTLPSIKEGYEYTLLVDLDETLIHFNEEEEFYLTRPGVATFLQELSKYYEIIIFTAALKDYADAIIDQIDIYNSITHRLYRHHCILEGEFHIKDLSKLDRDINKTIIIDNLAESFSRQPENGILVKDWFDDMEDTELSMLTPFLKSLAVNKVQDVREAIKMVLNY